jgi:DNA primase
MAIPDEDVAQVRAQTDIVAVIGEHTGLKQQGRRWVGICPFHREKTPSFSVNPELGVYYCFGCQVSGDAITFVRAMEHLDFVDAVRLLAGKAGVTLHEDRGGGEDRRKRAELLEAMDKAVAWYHERLCSAPDAGPARTYLRSRGMDGDVVRQFRLGWAPDDWDALSKALRLPERVLTATGLGFVNRRGRAQDSFRARILFPICDPSGQPVALGGRILPRRDGAPPPDPDRPPPPKYKNSTDTAIYAKRRTLYALNWAKKGIVAADEVVVCEGYTDVIGFFQAGVPRAVATCGTALSEEHFTQLRNHAKRIVLAYDADQAGQSATSRVYEWERRHEVDVAVADLPPGTDPGELARTDPEALVRAVAQARPFLQFRVDRVLDGADLSRAEGRARAAEAALAAVAEHPDDLVRDQYVMQVADRCRMEPDRLRQHLGELMARPPVPEESPRARRAPAPEPEAEAPPPPPRRPAADGSRPGLEALRLAVHRPEEVADRLEAVLFTDEVQRRAFEDLSRAESLHQAIELADPEVADLLRRLAVEEPVLAADGPFDPIDAVVCQLVRESVRRALTDLGREARTEPGDIPGALAEVGRVRLWLEGLDRPDTCRDAGDRLLAWLLQRAEEVG